MLDAVHPPPLRSSFPSLPWHIHHPFSLYVHTILTFPVLFFIDISLPPNSFVPYSVYLSDSTHPSRHANFRQRCVYAMCARCVSGVCVCIVCSVGARCMRGACVQCVRRVRCVRWLVHLRNNSLIRIPHQPLLFHCEKSLWRAVIYLAESFSHSPDGNVFQINQTIDR